MHDTRAKNVVLKPKISNRKKGNVDLMNIVGNVRFQMTEEIIEKAVLNILKRKDYDGFTVKDICAEAGINRTTFYAHYQDINDFMIKFEGKLSKKMHTVWKPTGTIYVFDESVFAGFFAFIIEYKIFYKAFAKNNAPSFMAGEMLKKHKELFKQNLLRRNINYTDAEIDYHLHWFGGGLKAICGRWIQNDCKESPEQMAKIIYDEYTNNAKFF